VASFRELMVWRKAFRLCIAIYRQTETFPTHERFGLTAELRKTVRSVVYNIAEGHRRTTRREFARFLDISRGSAAELETQLLICESLAYLAPPDAQRLLTELDEVNRMLVGLKESLRHGQASRPKLPTANSKLRTP
jgi:four helix bundle protein